MEAEREEEEEAYSVRSYVSNTLVSYEFDPNKATTSRVIRQIKKYRKTYKENSISKEELYQIYCKDFFSQKRETFNKADPTINYQLRTILRDKGVQVTKDNQLICSNLAKTLLAQTLQLKNKQKLVKYIGFTIAK